MTRKQLITACVDFQIQRGIVRLENRTMQIKVRLTGAYSMSKKECENWYNEMLKNNK